jgi:hypothetical protein
MCLLLFLIALIFDSLRLQFFFLGHVSNIYDVVLVHSLHSLPSGIENKTWLQPLSALNCCHENDSISYGK